ncbi:FadR family transcriptional regulator [Sesbania bispinosa]|nr:FadR family transcriptional regulator [Sesbania bispinosa]
MDIVALLQKGADAGIPVPGQETNKRNGSSSSNLNSRSQTSAKLTSTIDLTKGSDPQVATSGEVPQDEKVAQTHEKIRREKS